MRRHGRDQQRRAREQAIARARRTAGAAGELRDRRRWGLPEPVWGHFAKRRYFDRGRPRCGLCHWGKHVGPREPTVQERRQITRAADV